MKISEALNIGDECGYDTVSMNSDDVYGRISAAMVYVYPPGIPILCPGEVVSENVVNIIKQAVDEGLEVVGLEEDHNESETNSKFIKVLYMDNRNEQIQKNAQK